MGLRKALLLGIIISFSGGIYLGFATKHVCKTYGSGIFETFNKTAFHLKTTCPVTLTRFTHAGVDCHITVRRGSLGLINRVEIFVNKITTLIHNNTITVEDSRISLPYDHTYQHVFYYGIYTKLRSKVLPLSVTWYSVPDGVSSIWVQLDQDLMEGMKGVCRSQNGSETIQQLKFSNVLADDTCLTQDSGASKSAICFDVFSYTYECLKTQRQTYLNLCHQTMHDLQQHEAKCSFFKEIATRCGNSSAVWQKWRSISNCVQPSCPGDLHYQEMGPAFPPSCTNPQPYPEYTSTCLPAPGKVLNDHADGYRSINPNDCQCLRGKALYSAGQEHKTKCQSCICIRGQWSCSANSCPAKCIIEGQFISTFDGKQYFLQDRCTFMAAMGRNWTLKIKFSSQTVAVETAYLNINKEGYTFSVNSVQLNNIEINDISQTDMTTVFWQSSMFVQVQTSFGLKMQVQVSPEIQIYLNLPQSEFTKGLCGTFNNDSSDDLTTFSEIIENSVHLFSQSWSMGSCTPVPGCINTDNEIFAEENCNQLKDPDGLFADCHDYIPVLPFVEACVKKTCQCSTQLQQCLCVSFANYAKACAAHGIVFEHWRSRTNCLPSCMGNLKFSYSTLACNRTCRSLSAPDPACEVLDDPVEGCGCLADSHQSNQHTCSPRQLCGCHHPGGLAPPGSVVIGGRQCSCENGILNCPSVCDCTVGKICVDCSRIPVNTGQKTCESLTKPIESEHSCISGCYCPEGLLEDHNGGCVTHNNCTCKFSGSVFETGQSVETNCKMCTCRGGVWSCIPLPCSGVCEVFGKGQYRTFDSKWYQFDGHCQYTLVKNADLSGSEQFEIKTESVPCCDETLTCSRAISVELLGSVTLTLNDMKVSESHHFEDDLLAEPLYSIHSVGLYIIIIVPRLGLSVIWDKHTRVNIQLESQWRGRVLGLCGNFDGKVNNDLQTSGSSEVFSVLDFGNSWKSAAPPCSDVTQEMFPCQRQSYCAAWAQRRCMILRSNIFEECHLKVDPDPYYHSCVLESCSCEFEGKFLGFCTAVSAYAEACSAKGVCIDWRTPDLCPVYCDYYNEKGQYDWHYDPCGQEMTCGTNNNFSGKLEGCYPRCPAEAPYYDENTHNCSSLQNCTCKFMNKVLSSFEEVCSTHTCCVCLEGKVVCTSTRTPPNSESTSTQQTITTVTTEYATTKQTTEATTSTRPTTTETSKYSTIKPTTTMRPITTEKTTEYSTTEATTAERPPTTTEETTDETTEYPTTKATTTMGSTTTEKTTEFTTTNITTTMIVITTEETKEDTTTEDTTTVRPTTITTEETIEYTTTESTTTTRPTTTEETTEYTTTQPKAETTTNMTSTTDETTENTTTNATTTMRVTKIEETTGDTTTEDTTTMRPTTITTEETTKYTTTEATTTTRPTTTETTEYTTTQPKTETTTTIRPMTTTTDETSEYTKTEAPIITIPTTTEETTEYPRSEATTTTRPTTTEETTEYTTTEGTTGERPTTTTTETTAKATTAEIHTTTTATTTEETTEYTTAEATTTTRLTTKEEPTEYTTTEATTMRPTTTTTEETTEYTKTEAPTTPIPTTTEETTEYPRSEATTTTRPTTTEETTEYTTTEGTTGERPTTTTTTTETTEYTTAKATTAEIHTTTATTTVETTEYTTAEVTITRLTTKEETTEYTTTEATTMRPTTTTEETTEYTTTEATSTFSNTMEPSTTTITQETTGYATTLNTTTMEPIISTTTYESLTTTQLPTMESTPVSHTTTSKHISISANQTTTPERPSRPAEITSATQPEATSYPAQSTKFQVTTGPPITMGTGQQVIVANTSIPSTVISTSSSATTNEHTTPVCECKDVMRNRSWQCGDQWREDCYDKVCKAGVIEVNSIDCPPLSRRSDCPRDIMTLVKDEETCCETWQCDCQCQLYGDPHYISFQGVSFDFMENCTYTLVEEQTQRHGLSITVNNYFCEPGFDASCVKGVMLKFRNHTVTLMTTEIMVESTLNQETIKAPYENEFFRFEDSGYEVLVYIKPLRSYVSFSLFNTLVINLAAEHFLNNTRGQCGVCGGASCVRKNGVIEDDNCCHKTAMDWIVVDPQKPYCYSEPTNEPCLAPPPIPVCDAEICNLLHHKVFEECRKLVDLSIIESSCIFDFCSSINTVRVCSALEFAASECQKIGICVDWRNLTNGSCEVKCQDGMIYKECPQYSSPVCQGGVPVTLLSVSGVRPGCFCPDGLMLAEEHKQICVSECTKCKGPLGEPMPAGAVWESQCHICTCDNQTRTEECWPKPPKPTVQCDSSSVMVLDCCNDTICVEKTCEYNGQTYKVGDRWTDPSNPCVFFSCNRTGTEIERIVCPVQTCAEDLRVWDEDHCCYSCNSTCAPRMNKINLTVAECTQEVDLPVCEGQCETHKSWFQRNGTLHLEKEHQCCKETEYEMRDLKLTCKNNPAALFTYIHVTRCECKAID